jgi:tetratricopeptide (TPR) repeat protein
MNRLFTTCLVLILGLSLASESLASGKNPPLTKLPLSGDLLEVYKTGDIDAVIEKAEEKSLNDLIMILTEFKDAYSMAMEFSKKAGQGGKTLILLKKAESLDRTLSGGTGKLQEAIRNRLGKVYFVMGVDAQMRHEYMEAYKSFNSALEYANKRARKRLRELERKAKKLFEEAYVIKTSNPKAAAKRLNMVTNMISPEHVYYEKAVKLKYRLGLGPQPKKTKEAKPADGCKTKVDVILCNKLIRQNKTKEAIGCFKMVLKLEPANCDALIGMGVSYAKSGKGKNAAEFYEQFIKHCPKDLRSRQVRKTLEMYKEHNKTH